jgi:hypothetical protein
MIVYNELHGIPIICSFLTAIRYNRESLCKEDTFGTKNIVGLYEREFFITVFVTIFTVVKCENKVHFNLFEKLDIA